MNKLGLFLLTGVLIATPLALYAQEDINCKNLEKRKLQPITLFSFQGIEWVKKCTSQYPEILWLANEKVRKTEEGEVTLQSSYSERLFGKKYVEFDRTMMTLRCLQLILDGSEEAYQEFTEAQLREVKLSKESFENLHLQAIALLKSKCEGLSVLEMLRAIEAALILGDMGKSEKARAIFKPYGVVAPDHDDFYGEAIRVLEKYPKLCPTFDRLTPNAKKLLIQTANLAHYGHITHIEGGPGMFSKLKQRGLAKFSPAALFFDFFVHVCDVAGALGHVNNKSSLVYTEQAHLAIQGVAVACRVLTDPQKSEMDAYDSYLSTRAGWLGLNACDRADRVLTRIGAWLRLFTSEDGTILKQAILKFEPEVREKIISQIDIREDEELKRTPTYISAVLVNLLNNPVLGGSREERILQAVFLGLPFIARVLEAHKLAIKEKRISSEIPLNFNKAALVAKQTPKRLLEQFTIDSEGNVFF